MEENSHYYDVVERWKKEPNKVQRFKESDEALKVFIWRYLHMLSVDRKCCSSATGLPIEVVSEWWDGIDYVFQVSGKCHFHFPPMSFQRWRMAVNELLENNG